MEAALGFSRIHRFAHVLACLRKNMRKHVLTHDVLVAQEHDAQDHVAQCSCATLWHKNNMLPQCCRCSCGSIGQKRISSSMFLHHERCFFMSYSCCAHERVLATFMCARTSACSCDHAHKNMRMFLRMFLHIFAQEHAQTAQTCYCARREEPIPAQITKC